MITNDDLVDAIKKQNSEIFEQFINKLSLLDEINKRGGKNLVSYLQHFKGTEKLVLHNLPLDKENYASEVVKLYKTLDAITKERLFKNHLRYPVFLVGFMGAGKSTIGRKLSQITGHKVVEIDEIISQNAEMSITEIFEKQGEEYFRNLESNILSSLKKKDNIVSCGGGILIREENLLYMKKNGVVVYIKTKPETVFERLKANNKRPLIKKNMNFKYIKDMHAERSEAYLLAADIIVNNDVGNIYYVCYSILEALLEHEKNMKI